MVYNIANSKSLHMASLVGSNLLIHDWSSFSFVADNAYELVDVNSVKVNRFCNFSSGTIEKCVRT